MSEALPISVTGLEYSVSGQVLLDIEALEIGAGGPTVFLGPNGAGKSLFLRLLHGLIEPSAGAVLVGGEVPDRVARARQAMVFQHPVLLRRSVAANVAYALKVHGVAGGARRDAVKRLLAQSGLSGQARQAARTLSGGEQQRLAFVRAMAGAPDVLFLDEPTSSLDPAASLAIEEMIAQVSAAGTKIVMVTHDLVMAQRLATEVVFLHEGRLFEQTPGNAFFKKPVSAAGRGFLARNLAVWDDV